MRRIMRQTITHKNVAKRGEKDASHKRTSVLKNASFYVEVRLGGTFEHGTPNRRAPPRGGAGPLPAPASSVSGLRRPAVASRFALRRSAKLLCSPSRASAIGTFSSRANLWPRQTKARPTPSSFVALSRRRKFLGIHAPYRRSPLQTAGTAPARARWWCTYL